MDSIASVRRIFEHVFWADAGLLEALGSSDERAAEALREFCHVIGTEEIWLSRLQHRPPRTAVWPQASAAEVRGLLERTHAAFREYLATLRDRDLLTVVTYTNTAGQEFQNTVGDILVHSALHGQYHRGKVNLLLRQAGRNPVATDFIAFVRGVPAATEPTRRQEPGSDPAR